MKISPEPNNRRLRLVSSRRVCSIVRLVMQRLTESSTAPHTHTHMQTHLWRRTETTTKRANETNLSHVQRGNQVIPTDRRTEKGRELARGALRGWSTCSKCRCHCASSAFRTVWLPASLSACPLKLFIEIDDEWLKVTISCQRCCCCCCCCSLSCCCCCFGCCRCYYWICCRKQFTNCFSRQAAFHALYVSASFLRNFYWVSPPFSLFFSFFFYVFFFVFFCCLLLLCFLLFIAPHLVLYFAWQTTLWVLPQLY